MSLTRLKARRAEILEDPNQKVEKCCHLVQFYDSEKYVVESVVGFIKSGIKRNEAIIIIATHQKSKLFLESLAENGIEFEMLQAEGLLCIIDADKILDEFFIDQKIEEKLFHSKINSIINKIKKNYPGVRIYNELVSLLWEKNQIQAMLRLEQIWNDIVTPCSVSVLCSYHQTSFDQGKYLDCFQSICSNHTHVLPAEKYLQFDNLDEQLRAIAELQQQADSLKNELENVKKVEDALRESETFKNLIIESSRDCIKVVDLNANILFMSKGGLRTLEVNQPESIKGQCWLSLWQGKEYEAAQKAFESAKQGLSGEFTGFFPTLMSKTPKWWHVVISPILNSKNEVWRILIVSHDVTETHILESHLRHAIQTRDEFLSIASHELKTPITSLKLQAQIHRKKYERKDYSLLKWENIGKLIDQTQKQVDRLSILVDDMLDISRISNGKLQLVPEKFDLGSLVRDVVHRFDEQLTSAGCYYVITTEPDIVGEWDRFRIEQVITNLITNVLKYSPGKPVDFQVGVQKNKAVVSVQDQGIGIAQENLQRVFERFERATSSSHVSGLGLGLYISRQIIEAHRGQIEVESKVGEGSRFIVRLPLKGC